MTARLEHDGLQLYHGDALEVLRQLPTASADALVTDPPAGIEFMGKEWDRFRGDARQPGDPTLHPSGAGPYDRATVRHGTSAGYQNGDVRGAFIAALMPIFRDALRVLKPGAHGLVWALPRTSHWTATALEEAGFEVRDVITHHFGSGFPKSLDVAKAIDRHQGAARPIVGTRSDGCGNTDRSMHKRDGFAASRETTFDVTAPATDAARTWQGWGTALKPASEHWLLVRTPLAERTTAANVLAHGTGALNIDACRITANGRPHLARDDHPTDRHCYQDGLGGSKAVGVTDLGRWPANLVLSHADACVPAACAPGCPVAQLDTQSGASTSSAEPRQNGADGMGYGGAVHAWTGVGYGDAGGASRFFYVAKPGRAERNAGCEDLPMLEANKWRGGIGTRRIAAGLGFMQNIHPTVKAVALMRWLCRLVTPPGGTVLDPFVGSGSTLKAAHAEGFRAIGIEREAEYAEIAHARVPRQFELFAPREKGER